MPRKSMRIGPTGSAISLETLVRIDGPDPDAGDYEEWGSLGDVVDEDQLVPFDFIVNEDELKSTVAALLDNLTSEERAVLTLRFGLSDGEAHEHEEIAGIINVPAEEVEQIEAQALFKLRSLTSKRPSRGYVR